MSMLSGALQARVASLRQSFDGARPFRHVVIDDFFDPGFCRQLQADFPGFEDRYARTEMGDVGGKAVRQDLPGLSPAYGGLDRLLQSAEFLQLIGRITGIDGLLYDPDYVGGGTHENTHGQCLAAHIDFNHLPKSGWHRRLNLIVYLNDEWREEWGGCLDLHSDPWDSAADDVTRLVPAFNRCVIFETNEHSWHGFEAIDLPQDQRGLTRRSVAIYLYTKDRDAAESAPSHGTVYVPAGLPRDIAAGRTLTDGDHRELHRRFTQLRGQLKFLYRRELETSAQMATLVAALGEARAAVAFPLQGFQVQDGPLSGYWPDGWAGPLLEASFRVGRDASQFCLDVWIPPQLAADPQVTVRVNGEQQSRVLPRDQTGRFEFNLALAAGERLGLQVHASEAFVPMAGGDSADDRELSWRAVGATLA